MTVLTCVAVRQRLAAYHDNELPISDRIAVQSHLHGCDPCAGELGELESLTDAIREAVPPGPADDWTGLQPGVISRMRAEQYESFPATVGRMFDDLHLVWVGLAATAGTLICAAIVLGMLRFASPEREDSLAAMIAVVSAPSGSDLNPASLDGYIQVPSVPDDGIVRAMLEQSGDSEGEMVLALSAVITREGKISGLEVLDHGRSQPRASQLVNGFAQGRLEPAIRRLPPAYGADPVAVNLVWLVEHMTVRGKVRS
jgi:hypothetical protein